MCVYLYALCSDACICTVHTVVIVWVYVGFCILRVVAIGSHILPSPNWSPNNNSLN